MTKRNPISMWQRPIGSLSMWEWVQPRWRFQVNHWKKEVIFHYKANRYNHILNYNIQWLWNHGIKYGSGHVCEAEVHAQRESTQVILSGVGTMHWTSKKKTQEEQRVKQNIFQIWCPWAYQYHQVQNIKVWRPEVSNYFDPPSK